MKVRYVEYTDTTFLTKMLRAPEELHLGILGNVSTLHNAVYHLNDCDPVGVQCWS
jgi:hypothetical protein